MRELILYPKINMKYFVLILVLYPVTLYQNVYGKTLNLPEQSLNGTFYNSFNEAIKQENQPYTDDEDEEICEKNPCKNGATCISGNKNEYECLCDTGYGGTNCEYIKWCKYNNVCGSIPCKYNEKTDSGYCSCAEGRYFNAKTKTCEEIDKCLQLRIEGKCSGTHQTCINGECKCKENYAYDYKYKNCKPDFCRNTLKKHRCRENEDCIEGEESFLCSCKKGFTQIDGECVKVDKCTAGVSICHQKCENGRCSCFAGFKLTKDGYSCEPTTPPKSDCSMKCGLGICVKDDAGEKCICPDISHVFRNKTCIDKCEAEEIGAQECPIGCVSDEYFGYRCNCTGKYDFAEDGVHCKAKQMCSEGGGNLDCESKGGFCIDDFSSTKGYRCECNFGFQKNSRTEVCEHKCKINDCHKKQALCTINTANKIECICPPLLTKDTDGKCSQLAKYSYVGGFSIPKKNYEIVSEGSRRNKRDTNEYINSIKLRKEFEDSMKTIFDGKLTTSFLNYTDNGNDWECFMEIKLDKDPGQRINVVSTPSVCLPLSDEDCCLIQPNFVTKKKTTDAEIFSKTNPCEESVYLKLCGSETRCEKYGNGFKCSCKPGYEPRTSYEPAKNILVEVCEDRDECINTAICPNTTTCFNLPGDYTCKCRDGYRLEEGKHIKTTGCIYVCDPNPCVYGECSKTGRDGFSCSCDEFHTGLYCNRTNEAIIDIKKKGIELSAIIGGVLGIVLLVAIIIIWILLFRK